MANDTPSILITAQLNKAISIQNITADLKSIEKQLPNLNIKYNIDSSSSSAAQQTTEKIKKSTQDLSAQLDILKNRATGAYGNLTKYLTQNSQVAGKLPTQVNEIKTAFQNLNKVTDAGQMKTGLAQVNSQVTALKGSARDLGIEGRTVMGEFKNDLSKITQWMGAGTLLFGAIAQIKKMITTVSDLNKAATDLQMVMGGTAQQTAQLLTQYNALGMQLGATTAEVASSASEWLRQGKSIADTNILIQDSMILSKVSNIDSADATKYLTSAMKGYGVATKDTLGIVDKLNAVDLISATSASGLANAMSRTANMANLAGVSMDKLLGYLATVGEVTQKEMSEIGTSFQSIFSRMGNVSAGKDVDAEGESLNNVQTVLDKLNIHLRDSQGNFRNFGTVLDEVAAKWKSYNNVEQNQIGTAIAGVRQRENFTVLMQNYTKATEYATTAQDSNGSSMKKMEVYENSIEAATKRATASFEAFSTQFLNSGLVKGFVDFGASGVNALTSIGKALGTLPTLAGVASLALSALGKNVGKQYAYVA